ncbi:MAG TPA: hypothetical protein VK002_07080 [Rubricoccaceae bacterium]|nr:hypothetical protein [Rubricoccaceae bacterium]
MRTLGLAIMLTLGPFAAAQPLGGDYHGTISGTPATLTLQQDGAALRGAIDAGGYGYTLVGTAAGATASGTLTDPQAGSAMPFELTAEGDALTLTLVATDPYGQAQRVPLSFVRAGAAGPPQGSLPQQAPQAQTPPDPSAEANVQRDPALVGRWSYSDTYVSGDFSGTTRLSLQVNPDGTYLYGDGSVSIGGANDYGSYSGSSGGGAVTRGRWRTEGGVVYVQEEGSPGWAPYARYYVEGNQMMFTFGDGSRQVWSRQ